MENIVIMHLVTVVTLVTMAFAIISIPWLIGVALDRLFKIIRTDRDHLQTWIIGAIALIAIGLLASGIYLAYTDIFTYYTKP